MTEALKSAWHSKSQDFCTAVMEAQGPTPCSRCGDVVPKGAPVVIILWSDTGPNKGDPSILARWCRICIGIKAQNYTRIAAALSKPDWQERMRAKS